MTYAISITEDQVFTALRNWLLNALSTEVVEGLVNRVSTPSGGFVTMTGLTKVRLSTNETSYPDANSETNTQSIDFHIQLDIYGASSGDWASTTSTAFRSDQACTYLDAQLSGLAPLYAEDPRLMPMITGEQQYDPRWTMVVHLQYKPSITDVEQSASTVAVGIISVDATYPI